MTHDEMFALAAMYAVKRVDRREHRIGAVAVRSDGTIVHASNGVAPQPTPKHHAEARLAKKLDVGAVVYVVRIKRNGEYGLARPCARCRAVLAAHGVTLVYYTMNDGEFGAMML
jgi:cytidine deaminase